MSSSAANHMPKTSTEAKSNKKSKNHGVGSGSGSSSSSGSKSKTKNSNTTGNNSGGGGNGNSSSNTGSKSKESADSSNEKSTGGGGIFKPLVVLALPGVNLFRRFSQYRRLPQEPPKDKLEVELERLNNKIVSEHLKKTFFHFFKTGVSSLKTYFFICK